MKQIVSIFVLVLSVVSVSAQELKWGVAGGLNVSSPTDCDSQVGYSAGVKGQYSFKADKGFYLDFGVLLSKKGWKSKWYYDMESTNSMRWKADSHYLNIPIQLGYKLPVGSEFSLFGGVGPYFGVGLFGKYKFISDNREETLADNVFDDYINRFDWGIGAKVGVEYARHLQFSIGYDWGLKKIRQDKLNDNKNRNFNVSMTFLF